MSFPTVRLSEFSSLLTPWNDSVTSGDGAVLRADQWSEEILSHPRFDLYRRETNLRPIRDFLIDILEWLNPLLAPFHWLLQASPVAYYGLLLFLVTVLIVLVYVMVRRIRAGLAVGSDEMIFLGEEEQIDAVDFEAQALRHEAAGEWDEALRLVMRGTLLRIDPNLGRRHRGQTNRSLLRKLRGSDAEEPLRGLIEDFEACWYGGEVSGAPVLKRAWTANRAVAAWAARRDREEAREIADREARRAASRKRALAAPVP